MAEESEGIQETGSQSKVDIEDADKKVDKFLESITGKKVSDSAKTTKRQKQSQKNEDSSDYASLILKMLSWKSVNVVTK